MSKNSAEVRYRIVPPEFARTAQDKEELVGQIRAQRARLMAAVPPRHTRETDETPEKSLLTLLLADETGVFPRGEIMRYVTQNPKRCIASVVVFSAMAVFVVPKLLKRIGYKRLLHWGGVLSPLILARLEKMQADKNLKSRK